MENTDIQITVVVPVYNVEKYLAECLDSLVRQTLREIEILCVDDGSTDGSGRMCDEYAARDSRVRVIHKPNGGASTARNVGIAEARGTYLYFCDSDDYIDQDALALLCARAREHDLDLLRFGVWAFDEDHPKPWKGEAGYWNTLQTPAIDTCTGEELLYRLGKAYTVGVHMHLYRTAFLRDNRLTFFEGIMLEDVLYIMQCMLKAQRAQAIPERFYHYRIRPGSVMTKARGAHEYRSYSMVALGLIQLSRSITGTQTAGIIAAQLVSLSRLYSPIYGGLREADREKIRQEMSVKQARVLYESCIEYPAMLYSSRMYRTGSAMLYPAVKLRRLLLQVTRRKRYCKIKSGGPSAPSNLPNARQAQAIPDRPRDYRPRPGSPMAGSQDALAYRRSARAALSLMQSAQDAKTPQNGDVLAVQVLECIHVCEDIYRRAGKKAREELTFESASTLEQVLCEAGIAHPCRLRASLPFRLGCAVVYPAARIKRLLWGGKRGT